MSVIAEELPLEYEQGINVTTDSFCFVAGEGTPLPSELTVDRSGNNIYVPLIDFQSLKNANWKSAGAMKTNAFDLEFEGDEVITRKGSGSGEIAFTTRRNGGHLINIRLLESRREIEELTLGPIVKGVQGLNQNTEKPTFACLLIRIDNKGQVETLYAPRVRVSSVTPPTRDASTGVPDGIEFQVRTRTARTRFGGVTRQDDILRYKSDWSLRLNEVPSRPDTGVYDDEELGSEIPDGGVEIPPMG